MATIFILFMLLHLSSADKKYSVVDEFDSARVSNHYQLRILGMDILTLRSKPVLSLLKEIEDSGDQSHESTSDIFSLDWENWWTEGGEPVLEALKQNPHFVALVCLVVAVIRGLRSSAVQQMVDVKELAHEIVALLPPDSLEARNRMQELARGLDEVRGNQDVIARAFARVICLLRGRRMPVEDSDSD